MPKFLLLVLALAFLVSCSKKEPLVFLSQKSLDISKILQTQKTGSVECKVYNHGSETLDIFKLKASCGCVSTSINKHKIEPGSFATIAITIDNSRTEDAVVDQFVSFECNDRRTPVCLIRIHGISSPEPYFGPTNIALGIVQKKSLPFKYAITFRFTEPIELKAMGSGSIEANLEKQDGGIFVLQLTILPEIESGEIRGNVDLIAPGYSKTITITATIAG